MHVYQSILPVNLNVSWKFRLSSLILLENSVTEKIIYFEGKDLKMEKFAPYLMFNGSCEEAVNFYKECFNGKIGLM